MKTFIISMLLYKFIYTADTVKKVEKPKAKTVNQVLEVKKSEPTKETQEETKPVVPVVYDNMTMDELTAKLERNLNSSLTGQGSLIANYSIQLGVDPYLALAIILQETGCTWNCSALVNYCNNVGGIKGAGNCSGYQYYSSLEEGIKSYLELLYNNYYSRGLTTPELMNSSYAESTEWATKVNYYINQIKNS